ncbi:MAG TPA: acetyl-CoA synthetase [Thermofilum sp.]|nr:acetyl-CoA synthetase [Thermofilum sp.]
MMDIYEIFEKALRDGRNSLTLSESLRLISQYGLPVANFVLVKNSERLEEAFEKLNKPLVVKISSPNLIHKTEIGGVKLGIKSLEDLKKAYNEVISSIKCRAPKARIEGVIIQEMIKGDYEVIVGGLRDPQFGPVVAFGMGGVLVEVLKDIAFDLAPLSEKEAYNLINRIKGAVLLRGYRGSPPADLEKLVKVIVKASQLIWDFKDYIEEMDLNPIIISGANLWVVDARFKLRKAG